MNLEKEVSQLGNDLLNSRLAGKIDYTVPVVSGVTFAVDFNADIDAGQEITLELSETELVPKVNVYLYNGEDRIQVSVTQGSAVQYTTATHIDRIRFNLSGNSVVGTGNIYTSLTYNGIYAEKTFVLQKYDEIDEKYNDVIYGISQPLLGSGVFSNSWSNVGENKYNHIIIAVKPGQSIAISARSDHKVYFGVLKSYSTPVNGESLDYCSTISGRQEVSIGNTTTFTVPEDATYIVVYNNYNSTTNNYRPESIILNGQKDLLNGQQGLVEFIKNSSFLRYTK